MRWPPYLMQLKIHGPRHAFSIWLPLFIVGPLVLVFLLALFLIVLPFLLLSILFTWRCDWWCYVWVGVPAFFSILNSLPGFEVDVDDEGQHITIALY